MTIALDNDALREERLNRRLARIARFERTLSLTGLGFISPLMRAIAGETPVANLKDFARQIGIPLFSIMLFLFVWAQLAPKVQTSLGAIPDLHRSGNRRSISTRMPRETGPRRRPSMSARRRATPGWLKTAEPIRSNGAAIPANRPITTRSGPR